MDGRRHSAEQVDSAIAALAADGERFAHAQEIVTHAAPGLQRILAETLQAGGFFDKAHDAEVARVSAIDDTDERLTGVRTLVAEESRVGMLIGVAVGLELAVELGRQAEEGEQ
ncbi:MAG: hypothetical protein LT070_02940 [Solirubrobacteraceae bacterium]|nr:hypothetical protein [Solirubrobacteraceae bacterium]